MGTHCKINLDDHDAKSTWTIMMQNHMAPQTKRQRAVLSIQFPDTWESNDKWGQPPQPRFSRVTTLQTVFLISFWRQPTFPQSFNLPLGFISSRLKSRAARAGVSKVGRGLSSSDPSVGSGQQRLYRPKPRA